MRRQATLTVCAPLAALLAIGGCTQGTTEPAPSTPTAAPSASSSGMPQAEPAAVRAEVEHAGMPLQVVVPPVVVDGDRALVTLEMSMGEDAPAGSRFVPTITFASSAGTDLGQVRLLDPAAGTVLLPGVDEAGRAAGTREIVPLLPGESMTLQVLTTAPTSDVVDVLLPYVGLLTDVPVEEGDVPEPASLGAEGEVTFTAPPAEVFALAYDDGSSVRAEGESATVTLAADVLFGTDEFVLDEAAGQAVDQAAQQILETGTGGEVAVVGHTDDRADDAYNLDLSRKRAASVADRMRGTLGDGYTLAVDGRGEQEPVAEGTSPQARAANRRVEVRFSVAAQGDVLAGGAGRAAAPEAQGPVGSGSDAVEFTVLDAVSTARMVSVRRHGDRLVGELEITRVSGGGRPVPGLLAQSNERDQGRGIAGSVVVRGAANVTLLGPNDRVFPLDYVVTGDPTAVVQRAVLADQLLDAALDDGQSMRVTVVWPDLGQDTVDVDVPFRFRITDVPVEG